MFRATRFAVVAIGVVSVCYVLAAEPDRGELARFGAVIVGVLALAWFSWRIEPVPWCLQHALDGIDTERLAFRKPTVSDVGGLARTIDQEVARANGWNAQHVDGVLRMCELPDSLVQVSAWALLIDKTSSEVAGSLLVQRAVLGQRTCTLSYWMGPEHRGQGFEAYAARAATVALHAAGVERVLFCVTPDDTAEVRVMEAIGAARVSRSRYTLPVGSRVDVIWYAHDATTADERSIGQ